ncbi:MAG: signal peptidase I [Oscillospiraceae bacterium]
MILKALKIVTQTLAIICYVIIFGFVLIISPILFGWTPIVIQSPSMEPSIKTGSIVYYNKVDEDSLQVGDVITFKSSKDSPLVTHRVMLIDKDAKTVRTKGDANGSLDQSHLPMQNIMGVVGSFYLPKVGFYITYAQNPFVIAAVAAIIVANVVLGYVKGKKDDSEEENPDESE